MLLSRALNRGYGESRFIWPVSFGLLNNDCRWVFDEVQLMGPARATSAQLDGLRRKLGVAARCETVWMSATIDHAALRTVDHTHDGDVVRLSDADRRGPLRHGSTPEGRPACRSDDGAGGRCTLIAGAVRERHQAATRSIVVVNRVELAQQIHGALVKLAKRDAVAAATCCCTRASDRRTARRAWTRRSPSRRRRHDRRRHPGHRGGRGPVERAAGHRNRTVQLDRPAPRALQPRRRARPRRCCGWTAAISTSAPPRHTTPGPRCRARDAARARGRSASPSALEAMPARRRAP